MTTMEAVEPRTVLIIEDDDLLAQNCADQMRSEGFTPIVAPTGRQGLSLQKTANPSLILLDLSLPDMDGVELCQAVRQESGIPIIIVSGRGDEQDRVQGLDLGADDYVTKPISLRELTARVHAVLRRSERSSAEIGGFGDGQSTLAVGDVKLDLTFSRVEVEGKSISLTPNEFRLLAALMRKSGQVLSREDLLHTVWQESSDNLHLVEVHVANLRSKLEENPRRPRRLVTVRSLGYKFVSS